MNRREVLMAVIALGGADWTSMSFAQQGGKVWRVGVVWAGRSGDTANETAFLAGMKEYGYEVGRNLIVHTRHTEGEPAAIAKLVGEVIELKPDALLGTSTGVALEMKARTSTIPIVTGTTGDPVGSGLVTSLRRPGGNITGLALQIHELSAKHVELIAEMLPRLRRVAVLSDVSSEKTIREKYERIAGKAAAAKGITIEVYRINSPLEVREAFRSLDQRRADALLINPTPRFNVLRREICESAAKIRLPVVGFSDEWAEDGALLSYGPNFLEAYRRTAYFMDRIFKGAKAGDLPVEQPTRFSLVANARSAKALGVEIPGPILLRASRVIE